MNKLIGKMTVLFAAAVLTAASSKALTDGAWTYEINYGGAVLTGYSGAGGGVNIPYFIGERWLTVLVLGEGLFEGRTDVTSVTIPSRVFRIEDAAFRNTGLTEAVLPDSVGHIGENAFDSAGFERLEVGAALSDAVLAVPEGSRVEVRPGTYQNIKTRNRAVRVVALDGPTNTIIDANGALVGALLVDTNEVFIAAVTNAVTWGTNWFPNTCTVGCQTNTVLEGFTLTGSRNPHFAGPNGTNFDGSAAVGGTLVGCVVISNCTTYGGGLSYGNAFGCRFEGNEATKNGGGLYGCAVVEDCVFSNNRTSGRGGAACEVIHIRRCEATGNEAGTGGGFGQCAEVDGCTVSSNRATSGGGLNSCTLVQNSRIIGNEAERYGGGIAGGAFLDECEVSDNVAESETRDVGGGGVSDVLMANHCVVRGNRAVAKSETKTAKGGGVSGGLWENSIIAGNTAEGGVYVYGGGANSIKAIGCDISENRAKVFRTIGAASGGGVSGGTLTDCRIANNVAEGGTTTYGGGVHNLTATGCEITGNQASGSNGYGGGARTSDLTGCLVSSNTAVYGGGIHGYQTSGATGCTIVHNRAEKQGGGACWTFLTNCIVAHNQALQHGGWDRAGGSAIGWHNTFALNESLVDDSDAPEWGTNNNLVWGEKVGGAVQMPKTKLLSVVTNGTEQVPGAVEIGVTTNRVLAGEFQLPLEVVVDAEGNPWWPDSECCDWSGLLDTVQEGVGEQPLNAFTGDLLIVRTDGVLLAVRDDETDGLQLGWMLEAYIASAGGDCDLEEMTAGLEFTERTFNYKYWSTRVVPLYGFPVYAPVPCPMVDPWNGDYRLVAGSDAIDAGEATDLETDCAGNSRTQGAAPDLGALEADGGAGVDVGWRRIEVVTEGSGKTDVETITTEVGGNVTVTALDGGRPFLGWKIDGKVVSTNRIYTWENATEHGAVTAVFGNGDIWVDAERGNDSNGGSEASPLKTLQAAVTMASSGDTVRVKPGIYDRFAVLEKDIDIVGESGAEETIVDAKWRGRCAMLGSAYQTIPMARLKGFTLWRGCSTEEWYNPQYGAGVCRGRLEDCIIENCGMGNGDTSIVDCAELIRCIVRGGHAERLFYCWGFSGTNRDTLVTGNLVERMWGGYGENRNMTIAANEVSEMLLDSGKWYNCIVWGNGATNTYDLKGGWNCIEGAEPQAASEDAGPIWADNPEFVDPEHGDFRLSNASPYVDAGCNDPVDSSTDLSGNPRIAGAAVDLGCHEGLVVPCTVRFELNETLLQVDDRPLEFRIGVGETALAPEVVAVSGWRFDGWNPGCENIQQDTVIRGVTTAIPSDWTAVVHRGRVEENATWAAGTVHVVDGTVTVAVGTTLTIETGAVVKFTPGARLASEDGGALVSLGATFTHLYDDEVGGDTLGDGAARQPVDGEYTVRLDVVQDGTEYRYGMPFSESELEEAFQGEIIWQAGTVHVVETNYSVKSGQTLRLTPGTIVKFGAGASLIVKHGGILVAEGTLAKPVIFTSIQDDEHGGDTDGDGGMQLPSAGDWDRIEVSGTATFTHCSVLYGSGSENYGGIESNGGTVTFENGEIAHMKYECVNAHRGGQFTAHNSAFWDASLGFGYYGGSDVQAYNCVFQSLTTAIRQREKQLVNCVFADCVKFTDQEGDKSHYDHCLFWNPGGYGAQSFARVGENGNIWGDPKFTDAEAGDFHVLEGSACIDAGNGVLASPTDMFGNTRVTLKGKTATGIAHENGAVADIGVHEFGGRYSGGNDVDVTPADLWALSGGEGPVAPGYTMTLVWRLESTGTGAFAGEWTDRLTLTDADGKTVVLGELESTGRIEPGSSKLYAGTFTLPLLMDGEWRLGLYANIDRGVLEGGNTENNRFVSTNVLTVVNPTVAADGGTVDLEAGETKLVRLTGTLEEGDALWVAATAGTGPVTAWGTSGAVPGAERHWTCAGTLGSGALVAVGAVHDAEKTYLLLKNEGGDAVSVTLSRDAGGAEMVAAGLEREEVTAGPMVAVALEGVGLAGATALELWKDGELAATGTGLVATSGKVSAMFDLRGLVVGEYEVTATDGVGRTTTAPVALRLVVVPTATGRLEFGLTLPESVRDGRMYEGRVWYRNVGNADMAAPVFEVFTKAGRATVARTANGPFRHSGCILTGRGAGNPAVILRAGESGVAKFHFLSMGKYTLGVRWMKEGGAAQPGAWLERWAAEQARQEATAEEAAERQAEWETTGRQRIADYLAGFSTLTVETETGSVTGRLEDAATGAAVTGAVVRLELAGAAVKEETTGADGGFAFEGIWPLGTYAVTAEGWALDAESAKVSVTGAVEVATLEATRLTRVTGTVTAGGEGVSGVAVWATDAEGWRADCMTGAGGTYDLGWLADGEWVLRTAGTAGYAGARETVTVTGQGELAVALAMGPGVRWEGRVVDAANGAGVPDVELGVCDETGEVRFWATSGEGGAFAFPAVPEGTLLVGSLSAEWQVGDGVAEITPVPMGAGTVTGDVTVARAPLVRAFPDEGAAPLAVQFGLTAAGETVGAVAWSWDFDGDGVEDSDEEAPVWEYAVAGTNSPSVTLTREDGTSVTATLTVAVRDRLPTLYHDGVIVLLDGDEAQSADWAFAGWDADTGTLRVRQVAATPAVALAAGSKFVFAADEDGTLGLKAATGVAGPDGEGVWTVETEDAGLTAIYEQLDWSASTVVAGGGGASPAAKGGRRDGGNVAEGSFGDTFHETWSSGNTHVDWRASYNGNLYANILVQNGVAVSRGRGEITITETTTLRAGGKAESMFGVHHELINKTFQTGGIPIHVQGDVFVDLKMLLMLQGSHEHTAKLTQSFTYDGSGLHESHSFHYDPKISGMQLRESASGNSGLQVSALAQTPYGPLGFVGKAGFQGEQQFTRSGSSGHWLSTGNPYLSGEIQIPIDGIKQAGKNVLGSIASACSVNDIMSATMARFAEGQLMDLYSDKITAEVIQKVAPHLTLEEFKDGLAAAARQKLGELAGLDRFAGLGVDAILDPEIGRQIIPGFPTGDAWASMQNGLIPNVMEVVLNRNIKQMAFQEAYRRFVAANYVEEATKEILASGAAEAAADSGGMDMHVWLGTPADMESGSGVKIVNNTVQHAVVDYGNGRTDSLGSGENTLNGNYSKAGYYLGEIQVERSALSLPPAWFVVRVQDLDASNEKFPTAAKAVVSVLADLYEVNGPHLGSVDAWNQFNGDQVPMALKVLGGLNPLLWDSSGEEKIDDHWKLLMGENPVQTRANDDPDGDDLSNWQEYQGEGPDEEEEPDPSPESRRAGKRGSSPNRAAKNATHPLRPDTDGGGKADGVELIWGTNPNYRWDDDKVCTGCLHQNGGSGHCVCAELYGVEQCTCGGCPECMPEDDEDEDPVQSWDPNAIVGPLGVGDPETERYVERGEELEYTIYFENKADAVAAAQEIRVEMQLDPRLDWSTFEAGSVVVGATWDDGLAGKANWTSEVAMAEGTFRVRSEVRCDAGTGKVEWYVRAVDPESVPLLWPKDPYAGILPPNDEETHCGEGRVTFRAKVREDAAEGAVVGATATITFDYNEPIETNPSWWNKVAAVLYEVTFVDDDGLILKQATKYTNGTAAADIVLPATPSKMTGARCRYMFAGWSPVLADVTEDATYLATYQLLGMASANGVLLPAAWLEANCPGALGENGAAALEGTAANGRDTVWQCYVAGLDPNDAGAVYEFAAAAEMGDPDETGAAEIRAVALSVVVPPGRVAQLKSAAALTAPVVWTETTAFTNTTDEATTETYTDEGGDGAIRFYRVLLKLAE